MADRTSARLFGEFFELLASDEPIDRQAVAKALWSKTWGYDFSSYQMCCDDALLKLGLAKRVSKDGADTILYEGEDY